MHAMFDRRKYLVRQAILDRALTDFRRRPLVSTSTDHAPRRLQRETSRAKAWYSSSIYMASANLTAG